MSIQGNEHDTDEVPAVNLSEQLADEELIELLADKEHASWSHWMSYLFSKCNGTMHGDAVIPMELALHWRIQADMPYERLSEQEKQSDRDEVAKILPIIHAHYRPRELLLSELKQTLRDLDMWALTYVVRSYTESIEGQRLYRRVRELLGDVQPGGKED